MVSPLHMSDQVSQCLDRRLRPDPLWLRATRYSTFLIRADGGEGDKAFFHQVHPYQPCTVSKRVSSQLYHSGLFHFSHLPLLWCLNSFFSCLNLTLWGPLTSSSRGEPRVKEAQSAGQGRAAVSKSILLVGYTPSVTAFLFAMPELASVVSWQDVLHTGEPQLGH